MSAPGTAPVAEVNRAPLMAAALVIIVTVALYWPARGAGLVGDDFMILHRLRALAGPADALRFFRGEFFEYYRPLGFVSQALDWFASGGDPRQFHLTNIVLHAASAVLVLLIGHALSPRSLAGPLAASLFALHAANHEAVVWVSARFDLLATACALAAMCWMVRRWPGERWVPPVLFFGALLSKESTVALPIVAAAWSAFVLRDSTRATIVRVAPWLVALVAYSVLRQVAGGVSAAGGAARLPKLVVFVVTIFVLLGLSGGRWIRTRAWLSGRRGLAAGAVATLLAALVLAAALPGHAGDLAREKLSVAGFVLFYLATPVLDRGTFAFSDPATNVYWIGGAAGLAALAALVLYFWRPLLADGRFWFLAAFTAAALLPISALTEGKRYLYLPSAACALLAGITIAELHAWSRRAALLLVGLVLAISTVQVAAKIRDWIWAGTMTAEAARLVDSALAPSCGEGQVVFLTSPVGIRGVYTHFYYETFEPPRGCIPAQFDVLVRVMRQEAVLDVGWSGPSTIVITTSPDRGNLVASRDLRQFDLPLRGPGATTLQTPLGELRSETDSERRRITLSLAQPASGPLRRFFYYSGGRVRALAGAPGMMP